MNYLGKYAEFLRRQANLPVPIKIVFDASNGTAGPVLKEVFSDMVNVQAIVINDEISGDFPAHGPNPKSEGALEVLSQTVVREKADFGVILDGDADRVLFVDEKGGAIDSFDALSLIKKSFSPPYIVDVRALADFVFPGFKMIEVRAGRYSVSKALEENGADIGVERTGHFFFKNFFYKDSAILAVIYVANAVALLKKEGSKLSETIGRLGNVSRPPEMDFEIGDREGALRRVEEFYSEQGRLKIKKLDGISVFGDDFAFNVRSFNTEPVMRLNIAAKNKKILDEKLTEIKKIMGV